VGRPTADNADDAHHSCCEEEQRGGLGRDRLWGDGEVKVIWSFCRGELEIEGKVKVWESRMRVVSRVSA
jgi:hypothetical protein